MNKSTPDLPLHRARLRRALLASPQFEGSPFTFMKKLLPIGLALALLLTLNFVQKPDSTIQITPQASAEELIDDVTSKIRALSSDDLIVLEEKLGVPDVKMILEEAQQALDLRDITLHEETVLGLDDKEYCIIVLENLYALASDEPNCSAFFKDFRPVVFTASDGTIFIISVGQDLVPGLIFSYSSPISEDQTLTFTFAGMPTLSEEESVHFGLVAFNRDITLEENRSFLIGELPYMFEAAE